MTPEEREEAIAHVRDVGRTRGIDETLAKYDIDVILGPADCSLSSLAAASGQEPLSNSDEGVSCAN
jgi:hypothetical protein